jgi:hypothetical protein
LFPRRSRDRWLLETRFWRPWHLETWPQSSRRARIIYRAVQLLGVLGLQLPSRRVTVKISNGSLYAALREQFEALGIFLGTPGPNRKVVVFARNRDRSWFIKVPIDDKTRALVQTECATLQALAAEESLAPLVPRCHWIEEALAIEDVRASGARFAPLEKAEVLRVHRLLFERSRSEQPFAKLVDDWTAQNAPAHPHPDPSIAAKIAAARDAACRFVATIPATCPVECYEAHGDFTQWNVLRAPDGSARIIDWELFGRRAKFFDPFHYLVSQAILVDRLPFDVVLREAQDLAARNLESDAIPLYFGAYIVAQVFYYCQVYETQHNLHIQANWQLETWTQILEALIQIMMTEAGQDRR